MATKPPPHSTSPPHRLWPIFRIGYLYFRMRDCAEFAWLDCDITPSHVDESQQELPTGVRRFCEQLRECLAQIAYPKGGLLETASQMLAERLRLATEEFETAWRSAKRQEIIRSWQGADLDEPVIAIQYVNASLPLSPMASERSELQGDGSRRHEIFATAPAFQNGQPPVTGVPNDKAALESFSQVGSAPPVSAEPRPTPSLAEEKNSLTSWQLAERSLKEFQDNLAPDAQSLFDLGIFLGRANFNPRAGRWATPFGSPNPWENQQHRQEAIAERETEFDALRLKVCKHLLELHHVDWSPVINRDRSRTWWKHVEAVEAGLRSPDSLIEIGHLGLSWDPNQDLVRRGEKSVRITGEIKQKCLRFLIDAGEQWVSNQRLESAWHEVPSPEAIEQIVSSLRKDLAHLEVGIQTKRKMGRKLIDLSSRRFISDQTEKE